MTGRKRMKICLAFLMTVFCSFTAYSQATIVRGTVVDSITRQPIAAASVYFKGGRGTTTDADGKFEVRTSSSIVTVIVSSVGYRQLNFTVKKGQEQTLNVELGPDPVVANVTVNTNKRAKYTNRNNPAVELIRKVIENKEKNRTRSYDYVEYEQYEKLQMALSNASEKLTNSKLLKKYNFIFQNRDTTKMEGKSLLPVYLEETLSKKYYRKNPEKTKTIILGEKKVNFGEYVDNAGVSTLLNRLYENIDIYDNNIPIFTFQFLSPIANTAPSLYMFYIRDTITDENGIKLVKMYFTPRNTNDLLFRGNMYITLDGNYGIQKINMFISKNANINWVKELHADLNFERGTDGRYHLIKSDLMADMGFSKGKTSGGLFGERTVSFKNFTINKAQPDSVYKGESIVRNDDVDKRPDSFWEDKRHEKLSLTEAKVYTNIDSLEKMPSFRRTMAMVTLLFAGYGSLGPFEVGPVNAFYSFNPVEGFRLRLGGRTTPKFNKRLYFETYGAYGFKDERWKYFGSATYSLNNKSIYTFPLNYIKLSAQHDTKIPGQELQFVQEDNFLLSFKRGNNEKWLYNDIYRLEYVKEFKNKLSYTLGIKNWRQEPAGILTYTKTSGPVPENVKDITTTELTAQLRWAPKEQYYQGKVYRIPIINKYPIFTVDYAAGVKGILNSQYSYQRLNLKIDKRLYLSTLGYTDAWIEGGYIFGQVPFPLMNIHRANQTYSYQLNSYNLMNFLEFVSDHFASATIVHHFNGLFFNRVPLLKKLKLREVASFKILVGGVRNENNPALNPALFKYPTTDNVTTTFALNPKEPYAEGSVGIENIFKVLRVDLVKRFTYLKNPDVAEWGIRTRFKVDF